jgi:hypothetical protein
MRFCVLNNVNTINFIVKMWNFKVQNAVLRITKFFACLLPSLVAVTYWGEIQIIVNTRCPFYDFSVLCAGILSTVCPHHGVLALKKKENVQMNMMLLINSSD